MSTIQMTSDAFAPSNPVTSVTVFGDGNTTLEQISVTKHTTPLPSGEIASDLTSASVYMDATDFSALVSCLKSATTKAVITLTYSGTTVSAAAASCVLKAA
jgi:hypothetical protein